MISVVANKLGGEEQMARLTRRGFVKATGAVAAAPAAKAQTVAFVPAHRRTSGLNGGRGRAARIKARTFTKAKKK